MKEKIHYVIELALVVAVVILFVLQFTENKGTSTTGISVMGGDTTSKSILPIAYIDMDSLISNYTYSIDLNEQISKKHENARANLTEKLRNLQGEVAEFQRKVETNAFLSQERAQNEQQRLLKKREDLQQYEAQLTQGLVEEQARVNEDLRKTIIAQLREFNKNKGYHIVFGKISDNILFSDEVYNITTEVIDFLNKQHALSPVSKTIE